MIGNCSILWHFIRFRNNHTLSNTFLIKMDRIGSRVDMAGRRLSESSVESSTLLSSSHSRSRGTLKSHNGSERSMRSKLSTVESTLSLGSIDMDTTSIASSLDDDEALFVDPIRELNTAKALGMNKKSVRFSSVHLREHGICIGDNPSVSRGAPIALDWHFLRELDFSLDAFESSEHSAGNNGTDPAQPLKHSPLDRLHVLRKMGYSRDEIQEASKKAVIIKQQRIKTRRGLERRERLDAYVKLIRRFFQSRTNLCDPKKSLDASSTTVSTRSSSFDWSEIVIEDNSSNSTMKKSQQSDTKKRSSGRTIQWAKKEDWKDDFFRQLQRQKQESKNDSFLDQARHPKKISTLDLTAYREAEWSMSSENYWFDGRNR